MATVVTVLYTVCVSCGTGTRLVITVSDAVIKVVIVVNFVGDSFIVSVDEVLISSPPFSLLLLRTEYKLSCEPFGVACVESQL